MNPSESDALRFVNRKTGTESFGAGGKPNLVPLDSEVWFKVRDSVYPDNCPNGGVTVTLFSPIYPDDYKPFQIVTATQLEQKHPTIADEGKGPNRPLLSRHEISINSKSTPK